MYVCTGGQKNPGLTESHTQRTHYSLIKEYTFNYRLIIMI